MAQGEAVERRDERSCGMSGLYDPPRDEAARQDHKAVDAYIAHHFRLEPPQDPAARPGESVVPQELPQAPSEDEQFEAYMAAHFPGRA